MPPSLDPELASVRKPRARVAVLYRDLRQGYANVQFGNNRCRALDSLRLRGGKQPDFLEQRSLDFENAFFRRKNFRLQFLQFGCGKSLRVGERLFSLVS